MDDKWDEMMHRIQQGILAQEPEAAVAAAFQYGVEVGRTLESISYDMDRLATAAERLLTFAEKTAEPEVSA